MTSQPDAVFIPCHTFGGGWIVPETDIGRDWLEAWFNDCPTQLAPIDEEGWILEPQDCELLAEQARGESITIALRP